MDVRVDGRPHGWASAQMDVGYCGLFALHVRADGRPHGWMSARMDVRTDESVFRRARLEDNLLDDNEYR